MKSQTTAFPRKTTTDDFTRQVKDLELRATQDTRERKQRIWSEIQAEAPELAKLLQMFRGQIADLVWKGETLSGKPWERTNTVKLSPEGLADLLAIGKSIGRTRRDHSR